MNDAKQTPRAKPVRERAASAAEVPEALREHYQFDGNFCAVSGFECIAKLEGAIDRGDFPLQCDSANKDKGFEPAHRKFLDEVLCLDATDAHFNTGAEAAALIRVEVSAGRFPLVSMPVQDATTKKWSYHVYIFALLDGEALFINPAIPSVILRGFEDLPKALDGWRQNHPLPHKTVHVLWYQRRLAKAAG